MTHLAKSPVSIGAVAQKGHAWVCEVIRFYSFRLRQTLQQSPQSMLHVASTSSTSNKVFQFPHFIILY